jgi:hypothetical protein
MNDTPPSSAHPIALGYVIKDGVKTKTFWDGKIISEQKTKQTY